MPRRRTKTSFKKGNKAGKGRPKSAYKIHEVAPLDFSTAATVHFDRNVLKRYIQVTQELSEDEIRARLLSNKVSAIEKTVCRFWLMALNGNAEAWRMLLEYNVGKPKSELEISRPNKFDGWTTEQLRAYREELVARNRETLARIEARQVQQENVIDITPKDTTPTNESIEGKSVINGSD